MRPLYRRRRQLLSPGTVEEEPARVLSCHPIRIPVTAGSVAAAAAIGEAISSATRWQTTTHGRVDAMSSYQRHRIIVTDRARADNAVSAHGRARAVAAAAVAQRWPRKRRFRRCGLEERMISYNSRRALHLGACSLTLLAFLGDPTAAFQPTAVFPTGSRAGRSYRKYVWAETPCQERASDVLLHGSFTGRLNRQARRIPFVWGLRRCSVSQADDLQSRTALDASPTGGDWGSGGGGIAGSGGWRGGGGGIVAGRTSAENSMGAREAHAMAQAPTYDGLSKPAASSTTVDMFPDIAEGLACHKRIHGHVKIIPTFKVPSTTPWPEKLWGMDLGKLVYKLRNEKEMYRGQFPDQMALLESMGFEWEHSAVADEWDHIIWGVETFVKLHGHARVPTRFTIPSEEPWPMEIWGHKLGTRIAQMRQTGRYLGDGEETISERRAILDKLGFEWRLRVHDEEDGDGNSEDFGILCEGLQIYRELGGSVPNMPPTFVIPNADPWPLKTRGFPLGNQVRQVRSKQKYAKDSQENADRLVALGVPISSANADDKGRLGGPTDTRFDKLCKSLEMFLHLYGHTQVPVNFEVPRADPWPIWTWGTKLGMSLTNIVTKGTFVKGYPERQARLEALGFDTDPGGVRAYKERIANGMSAQDALAETQAEAKVSIVKDPPPKVDESPPTVVEDGDPPALDGSAESKALIESMVESLRQGRGRASAALIRPPPTPLKEDEREVKSPPASWTQQQQQQQEDSRGPAWERNAGTEAETEGKPAPSFMRTGFTDAERALMTDQADLRYWPEESHHQAVRKQLPLLGHLARGNEEIAQVDGPIGTEMVKLPGVLSPTEWDPKRKKLESADVGYSERHDAGELDQEEEEQDSGIIDRYHGRRLRKGLSTTLSGMDWCSEEDKAYILKVGFEWDEFHDGFRWDDVAAGLELYKTLYGELPDDEFEVPVDYEWPRELAGMQLGAFCRQMRVGDIWAKHDPTRRKALDELGFDWGNEALYLDFQWPEVIVVFYSIMKLRGHLDISPQYVIPDLDPWPLPIRGYPAGFFLNVIRAQKDLLMEHYPDRFELLRCMGVTWSQPTIVDWEKEEEHVDYAWRNWGHTKLDEDADELPVDPEFGLKDADPLL